MCHSVKRQRTGFEMNIITRTKSNTSVQESIQQTNQMVRHVAREGGTHGKKCIRLLDVQIPRNRSRPNLQNKMHVGET